MSNYKKAIKKLKAHKEYFSNIFFESKHYQNRNITQNFSATFESIRVILACEGSKKIIEQSLVSNLKVLNFILSRYHESCIKSWYERNPQAQAKRLERKQEQIVRHLKNICADYKSHLMDVVHKSTGCLATTISLLTNITTNLEVAAINQPVEINSLTSTPMSSSVLHAIKKYKEIGKLQNALLTPLPATIKLKQCENIFINSELKQVLSSHRDSWTTRVLGILLNIFSLALPSKVKQNTFCFWKAKGANVVNNINEQIHKANKLAKN